MQLYDELTLYHSLQEKRLQVEKDHIKFLETNQQNSCFWYQIARSVLREKLKKRGDILLCKRATDEIEDQFFPECATPLQDRYFDEDYIQPHDVDELRGEISTIPILSSDISHRLKDANYGFLEREAELYRASRIYSNLSSLLIILCSFYVCWVCLTISHSCVHWYFDDGFRNEINDCINVKKLAIANRNLSDEIDFRRRYQQIEEHYRQVLEGLNNISTVQNRLIHELSKKHAKPRNQHMAYTQKTPAAVKISLPDPMKKTSVASSATHHNADQNSG